LEITHLYELYLQHPSVATDTRKLKPGMMYFALKGPNFDGNKFAQQALDAGAAYAVIDDAAYRVDERCIVVPDVLACLQALALHHRQQFDIPFIAITGSNGKTTTKELVTAVLRAQYVTYATEGNLNNHIGVPLTLLRIGKDAQMAVIEMGANHQQEIASYCAYALPTHGIITNAGKAHIEGFGGVEGVRKGKGELYDFIRAHQGVIFRNADLDYLEPMAAGITQQITYGTSPTAQYSGQSTLNGLKLDVQVQDTAIHSQLVGDYNFPNIMLAVAVGLHFGIDLQKIKAAIEDYAPDNSRSQLLQQGSNAVILDAYNANPTSMRAAIQNFAQAAGTHKLLWLGAMKEMGKDEAKEHEELAAWARSGNWDQILLVGHEFEPFSAGSLWFEDSAKAAAYIAGNKPENALILIKGSRGSKMELLLEALR
jgi:UDP-N-acetylmuramoyl-tripeptide--D-alanyl-D-alanine ligase